MCRSNVSTTWNTKVFASIFILWILRSQILHLDDSHRRIYDNSIENWASSIAKAKFVISENIYDTDLCCRCTVVDGCLYARSSNTFWVPAGTFALPRRETLERCFMHTTQRCYSNLQLYFYSANLYRVNKYICRNHKFCSKSSNFICLFYGIKIDAFYDFIKQSTLLNSNSCKHFVR